MQTYFDYLYNPVYDITTARLNQYRKLQTKCIEKLDLCENDNVLCVGLGTGNELVTMLKEKLNINIVGIDYSKTALRKASKKAKEFGKRVELFLQDARNLEFASSSFDKVLCIHVMDFVSEDRQVTLEILRVLKNSGRFVITYPSKKEGFSLGGNLLKEGIRSALNSKMHSIRVFLGLAAQITLGFVYLPLLARPNKRAYSRQKIEAMISHLSTGDFQIEEDSIYQDFIVSGRKSNDGG